MVEPEELTTEAIYAPQPVIDNSNCRYCGICSGYCPEKAIQFNRFIPSVTLIVSRCCACGYCIKSCNRNGIQMKEKLAGRIWKGSFGQHLFIAGKLEEKSDFKMPLLKAMLNAIDAKVVAVCDFEPGCETSVSFCLEKMDIACILVQPDEDWERKCNTMIKQVEIAGIPAGIILNKINAGAAFVSDVKAFCANHSIPLLGIIPYDKGIENTNYPIIYNSEDTKQAFLTIWENLPVKFPALFLK